MRAPRRIVGPFDVAEPLLRATHEVVVRRHDAGRDEDVLLERRVRGDVGRPPGSSSSRRSSCRSRRASRGRATTSSPISTRSRTQDWSPRIDARADRRAGEDDRAGRDDRAVAEHAPAAAARASRSSAARASAACRRPRPRAPSRPRRARCPGRRSRVGCDLSATQRLRQPVERAHDAQPVLGLAWSPGPSATSRRKCSHSSRSGSSFGIFGLKMSPVRVRHSP